MLLGRIFRIEFATMKGNYWIGITGLELPDWNYRTTTKKIAGK